MDPKEAGKQMSQSASSWRPAEGASADTRRTQTAGGQRHVSFVTRSTGSLPLTNTSGRHTSSGAPAGSPTLPAPAQKRGRGGAKDDKSRPSTSKAKAEVEAAQNEGHLPELLPAFKPGKIHKSKVPAWLVAL